MQITYQKVEKRSYSFQIISFGMICCQYIDALITNYEWQYTFISIIHFRFIATKYCNQNNEYIFQCIPDSARNILKNYQWLISLFSRIIAWKVKKGFSLLTCHTYIRNKDSVDTNFGYVWIDFASLTLLITIHCLGVIQKELNAIISFTFFQTTHWKCIIFFSMYFATM